MLLLWPRVTVVISGFGHCRNLNFECYLSEVCFFQIYEKLIFWSFIRPICMVHDLCLVTPDRTPEECNYSMKVQVSWLSYLTLVLKSTIVQLAGEILITLNQSFLFLSGFTWQQLVSPFIKVTSRNSHSYPNSHTFFVLTKTIWVRRGVREKIGWFFSTLSHLILNFYYFLKNCVIIMIY